MTECCHTPPDETAPRRGVCPANGRSYASVPARTLLHQLRTPWTQAIAAQPYFFCSDPACEVVYFGRDGSTFTREALRGAVGQKGRGAGRMFCYCFDITYDDVSAARASGDDSCKDFVIAQTRAGNCACEVRNPSGRCCLRDFPK